MPQIKFERIVSCSSEDPAYPATNLLLNKEVSRKWKCKEAGEKSASVIIQFKEPHVITGIDIGNESSSFVEVLVSRTSTPDDFKVILLMSSFMTPMDARSETNRNRVRMFSQRELSETVQKEKWDRIKVVCTQQFNKHLQYGLSFLVLHTVDVKEEEKTIPERSGQKLGRFALKEEDQSDISVGSFFSRRKDISESSSQPQIVSTGAAAVRDASAAALQNNHKGHVKRKNSQDTPESKKRKAEVLVGGETQQIRVTSNDQNKKKKTKVPNDTALPNDRPHKTSNSDVPSTCTPSTSHSSDLRNQPPNVIFKTFNKLLEGVEIVISGYVNPGRADIRDKALKMGAKYKPDWCSTSSHLICAFANTPKFQQVKGKGVIVSRDWIDECYKQRKKLPWRRFAIDKAEKEMKSKETETEVWELIPPIDTRSETTNTPMNSRNSLATKDTRLRSNSSSDSEDEIERIKAKQVSKKNAIVISEKDTRQHLNQKLSENANDSNVKLDPYEGSTDIDSEEETKKLESMWTEQKLKDRSSQELPCLPDFFKNKRFYLSSDLLEQEKQSLSRYVIAFGGEVLESPSERSHFVLAKKKETISKISSGSMYVSPDWIWECNDARKLVPHGPFQLL